METRTSTVNALIKLVDICNQSGLVFRVAAEHVQSEVFGGYSEHVRETFDRFGFELQTEIRRLGGGDIVGFRTYTLSTTDVSQFWTRCEEAFKILIAEYAAILAGTIPGHARAMVQRQSDAVIQLRTQFGELYRKASA